MLKAIILLSSSITIKKNLFIVVCKITLLNCIIKITYRPILALKIGDCILALGRVHVRERRYRAYGSLGSNVYARSKIEDNFGRAHSALNKV